MNDGEDDCVTAQSVMLVSQQLSNVGSDDEGDDCVNDDRDLRAASTAASTPTDRRRA